MVLEKLRALLCDRFGCDGEDVELATSLDELNLYADDLDEIAVWFGDAYGVEVSSEDLRAFETVEDIVGYIEDRMGDER